MKAFRTNYAGLPLPMKPQTGSLTEAEVLDLLKRERCVIQQKLDGINGRTWKGRMWSVSGRPIANKYVQEWAADLPDCLHGELIWYHNGKQAPLYETSSIVSSIGNKLGREVVFVLYDTFRHPEESYEERYNTLLWLMNDPDDLALVNVPFDRLRLCRTHFQSRLEGAAEWLKFELQLSQDAHEEGIIIRPCSSPYHFGRCGRGHPSLFRFKFFEEFEAKVIGFTEAFANLSEAEESRYGMTKRASSVELREPKGVLGSLVLERLKSRIMFECGTGFTEEQRKQFWLHRKELMGKIVTVRCLRNGGKDKPRNPVFKAFRDPSDMTDF